MLDPCDGEGLRIVIIIRVIIVVVEVVVVIIIIIIIIIIITIKIILIIPSLNIFQKSSYYNSVLLGNHLFLI